MPRRRCHTVRARRLPALSGSAIIIALSVLTVIPEPVRAEPDAPLLWREVWAGADVASNVWLAYSGATVAPMGHIHEDGLRLRVTGGYGQYRYPNSHNKTRFEAVTAFGDVLAGYLMRFDPLTVKVLAGASYVTHDITPIDEETVVIGGDWGAKGVVELWLNIGNSAWSSLDISYTTAHETGAVRTRAGYRITPELSLGLEAGLNIDGQAQCKMRMPGATGCRLSRQDPEIKSLLDYGRAGLFARYEWTGGEVSLSAGGLGQFFTALEEDGADVQPYVTVNWITQF